MEDKIITSTSETVEFENIQTDFLNLRIGEEIPYLEIKQIRKITNKNKQDNLSSVNYKYLIESHDNKILKVNSWSLWNKIKAALLEAGKLDVALNLKHIGIENYSVKVI